MSTNLESGHGFAKTLVPGQSGSGRDRRIPVYALLLAALICETQGFRLMGIVSSMLLFSLITAAVLAVADYSSLSFDAAMGIVVSNAVFCIYVLVSSILTGNRPLTAVGLRMIAVALYFFAVQISVRSSATDTVLRSFANIMFWFVCLNAAIAIVVWTTGLPPLFQRQAGDLQVRIYHHYLFTTSEENNLRFISFFDEPSDTVWLATAALFLQLYLGARRRAAIMAASLVVTISGSLVFAYLLMAICVAPFLSTACILSAGYFACRYLRSIYAVMFSVPALSLLALRFFGQSGSLELSRTSQFQGFISAFHFFPSPISGADLFSAPNGSFVLLLRYGIFYVPLFGFTLALLMTYAYRGFTRSKYLGCFYTCFLVLFFVRESPLFSPLFWVTSAAVLQLQVAPRTNRLCGRQKRVEPEAAF